MSNYHLSEEGKMNYAKTFFLLAGLTLLLIAVGGMLGGQAGMQTAFFMACLMNLGAYWFSDSMVLSMYRAQPLGEEEAPHVYKIVRKLSAKAGMPVPKIYRVPSPAPNAFATGRNPSHAVVAVTDGILGLLNEDELEGVLAHELSHVIHRDILISSIAAAIAGAIGMIASMARWSLMFDGAGRSGENNRGERNSGALGLLLGAILAPFAAMLIQMAVSRSREFDADDNGGRLCGNPLHLASALKKLDHAARQIPMHEANPATAHLFIVSPLTAGHSFAKLFSTHPPLEERIRRLEKAAVA